jgi:hypothetical protein
LIKIETAITTEAQVLLDYIKQEVSFRPSLPSGVCSRKYIKAYFETWDLLIGIYLSCKCNTFIVFNFMALMFSEIVISMILLEPVRVYKM